MKAVKGLLTGCFVFLLFAAFVVFFYNPDRLAPEHPAGKTRYYTRVVNDEVWVNHQERYVYTLDAYTDKGKKRSLTFTSSKQLREGAYLELYVARFRGVTYWQEVPYDELPERVKRVYGEGGIGSLRKQV